MTHSFLANDTGAVTVDWVVLTAALTGIGLAVMGSISIGVEDISYDIKDQLQTDIIRPGFGPTFAELSSAYWEAYETERAHLGTGGQSLEDFVAAFVTNLPDAQLDAIVAAGKDSYQSDVDALNAYIDSGYDPALRNGFRDWITDPAQLEYEAIHARNYAARHVAAYDVLVVEAQNRADAG